VQGAYIKTVAGQGVFAVSYNGACPFVQHHRKAPFHYRERASRLNYGKGQFMSFTQPRNQICHTIDKVFLGVVKAHKARL
jgi:hypothetical protein